MIDLRRLQVLRTVRQHRTVTGAAAALHLTPSAVSQQVQSLARDLGVALVERQGRGVVLTAAAETLLRHADVLYAQWEVAQGELAAHRDGSRAGPLSMGAFPTALAALVAPAAVRMEHSGSPAPVRLTEAESSQCFDLLQSGVLDVAVVVPLPDSPAPADTRFEQEFLLDDPQDLIVPHGHALDAGRPVALADAREERFVAAPRNIDQHQLILAACQAAGFTPRIEHEAQEWNAIVSLVAHGFGVSLLPRLAPIPSGLPVRRVPLHGQPSPSRRLLTCVRRGSARQRAIAGGLAALRAVAAEHTTGAAPPRG
ncbi:LysR family transcriptional regulator [Streptomyces sp. TRM 70351]|uniref:LysR family transcriptional regulator n=1 Tax=Streptomyces sp. TRM 70351 TaxID=3116552 RepID=UPI002E7AAF10|nr:LysR family transcriptional regulator [Streptomyces sp. TRM 70351]MEE1927862.1 LysR family transcriptional regulator [Streptomyces sp. TRM 70351]